MIAKELERIGQGVLSGKQSALYRVLRNLEAAGLLESHIEPSVAGPPRRYYRINDDGRAALRLWVAAWSGSSARLLSLGVIVVGLVGLKAVS